MKAMRTYLNLEEAQVRTLLDIFVEISLSRDLTQTERYIQAQVRSALTRTLIGL